MKYIIRAAEETEKSQGDCISREALKKHKVYSEERREYIVPVYNIDNAPTVEQNWKFYFEHGYKQAERDLKRTQDRWIPVSERLPDDEDYHDCYGFPDGVVIWQTDNGDIGFGWYYRSTKCWSDINDYPIKSGKVIAWRPLPEPYKKGGAE